MGRWPFAPFEKRNPTPGARKPSRTIRRMGTKGMPVDSSHRYAAVICDDHVNSQIPPGFPVLRGDSLQSARRYDHVFVLCSAMHLPEAAKLVSAMNREHRLQALFVRSDVDPALLPQMLERAGLRFTRNILVHSTPSLPRRVLRAWLKGAQSQLIAEARVAEDRLLLISCEPKMYEIHFKDMPPLSRIATRERANFEIAGDGSFIWWSSADIHLDLDAVRTAIDPRRRARAARLRRDYGRRYGQAIATLRRKSGLRQTDINGISERQLRRMEDSGAVSLRALEQLAKAHRMSTSGYLSALARAISRVAADEPESSADPQPAVSFT